MGDKKCDYIDFHLINVDDSLGSVANEENEDDCKKEGCHCRVPVVDHFQTHFLSNKKHIRRNSHETLLNCHKQSESWK